MARLHLNPAFSGPRLAPILFGDGKTPGWQAYRAILSSIDGMSYQIGSPHVIGPSTKYISVLVDNPLRALLAYVQ